MNIEQERVKYDSINSCIVLKGIIKPSIEHMEQDIIHILDMSASENCLNVLIDATETIETPSIWKLSNIGNLISPNTLELMKMRIAFVITDKISSSFRFIDNILANRLVHTLTFKNLDEAKEWLLYE